MPEREKNSPLKLAPRKLSNKQSNDYFFVILSAAKNLSFKAAEIRNEAALRSE